MINTLFEKTAIRDLYNEMRKSRIGLNFMGEVLNYPQPGFFGSYPCKYLFIGQNPAVPKLDKNPSDKVLMDFNSSNEEHHNACEESQKNWHFYKYYIKKIIGDSNDFSIINIVFYPTLENKAPSHDLIFECGKYLKLLIDAIKPKNIICVGNIASQEVENLKLNNINVIKSKHYSWLMRQFKQVFEKEINMIINKLE